MSLLRSLVVLCALFLGQVAPEDCKKQNKCECSKFFQMFLSPILKSFFPNRSMNSKNYSYINSAGSDGWGFNLSSVVNDNFYLEAITNQNLTFFFHPCGDSTTLPILPDDVENTCRNGYSLCMYNVTEKKAVTLGTNDEMIFKRDGDSMQVMFTRDSRESSVSLECTPKAKTSVLYAGIEKIDQVVSEIWSTLIIHDENFSL